MFATRTPPHRVAAAALCFTLSALGTTALAADPPKAEVWASNVLDARGLRRGDKGTVFVSSPFVGGKMFPAKYHGAMFIARHGSWNRTQKVAADIVVAWSDGKGGVSKVEPFLSGFSENNDYLGRPADVMVMKDGSMLVSDDHAGAIYRISYSGK